MHTIEEARAHSRGPVQLTAGGWRPAMRWDGPTRASARAHAKGLRVGRPVRAEVVARLWGTGDPQRPLVPLEFGERISNYRIQQAVRTHSIGGTKWRPTPRQRRRLDHKANHAAAPFRRPQPEPFAEPVVRADDPASVRMLDRANDAAWSEALQPAPRGPMIAQGNGFRVVDRRGEHR